MEGPWDKEVLLLRRWLAEDRLSSVDLEPEINPDRRSTAGADLDREDVTLMQGASHRGALPTNMPRKDMKGLGRGMAERRTPTDHGGQPSRSRPYPLRLEPRYCHQQEEGPATLRLWRCPMVRAMQGSMHGMRCWVW